MLKCCFWVSFLATNTVSRSYIFIPGNACGVRRGAVAERQAAAVMAATVAVAAAIVMAVSV